MWTVVIIIILFGLLFYPRACEYFTMTKVKSTVDNAEYLVVKSYADKEQAANLMAEINLFTVKLIQTLKSKYSQHDPQIMSLAEYIKGREITSVLTKKFKSESLQENLPDSPNKTSYTSNKGEIISLCLREKKTGKDQFHDLDTLKFVLIHELGHIITPELNHSVLFWSNFRFLLEFCNKYKLYTSPDFDKHNVNYCGLEVSYTPINDKTLSSYFS
jgi:hypothetical protein